MSSTLDRLTQDGCKASGREKLCRSRGGESCAFDGAMIVLQPIADTAHIVHGPIACCGNSWEGRGTRSSKGDLHVMGFTTDMAEIDIVYGAEDKLYDAIIATQKAVAPKAIFVYATCVSGLIGEDIEAVCKKAEAGLGIRVIPVLAPGFVGPKNLGNRIAGEVLLKHVIGTGEPSVVTHYDINLIGEYNIAGDLWHVEPLLERAGFRVLSKITGDAAYEEITWAHRARLNVVVCSRAMINVAREMERKYGIPYVEVSFFGSTEIAKALRAIADGLMKNEPKSQRTESDTNFDLRATVEQLIKSEERLLKERLKPYRHLRGKKAVLYTGGVKSWSFISALRDIGIDTVAVGTKKSSVEDEFKIKEIMGPNAPLIEDVSPKNLIKLLRERNADMLVAGGRNQYLAAKEGCPFVDVNQERHIAYAGYSGLVNFAAQLSNSVKFYEGRSASEKSELHHAGLTASKQKQEHEIAKPKSAVLIDPLKHSPFLGAAIAFQGIDRALPVVHGAQGCTFLGKVLLTKHFREPMALVTSKLFVENVVMGSEDELVRAVEGFMDKNKPSLVGILTTGLTEVKGDDVKSVVRKLESKVEDLLGSSRLIHVPTPDYEGGLETGYARAVEAMLEMADPLESTERGPERSAGLKQVNILVGSHLTPGDVTELREIAEAFGLKPVILPDLSALDGSRRDFSPLASGGTGLAEIRSMGKSEFTMAIGTSMEPAAKLLHQSFGIEYKVFDSISGLAAADAMMDTLRHISGGVIPAKYDRQRRALIDGMRDAHEFFGGRSVCLALEPDHALQASRWISEMGATVELAVIPMLTNAADKIYAGNVQIGGLHSIQGGFDVLIANSHAKATARKIKTAHYEMGFPVYKSLGYTAKVMIGYRGTLNLIHDVGSVLMKHHQT
jgi:nitrogenase molybdenum-cofactor synthesis protein NifE